jgi:hypothetical protein
MPVSDTYPVAFSVCFSSLSWTLYQVHGFCFKIGGTFFSLKKRKDAALDFLDWLGSKADKAF